jgi:hypothetical protein
VIGKETDQVEISFYQVLRGRVFPLCQNDRDKNTFLESVIHINNDGLTV